MSRLLREARAADEGTTLIELMVASILLVIVLGILTGASIVALRSATGANVRSQNVSTARVAADRMSKELRAAIRPNRDMGDVTAASATSISFFSEINTVASGSTAVSAGPTAVTFALGTDPTRCPSPDYCLFESDTPTVRGTDSTGASAWEPGNTTTTRALVHGVNPNAAQQLFTYYKTVLGGTTSAAPTRTTVLLPLSNGTLPTASVGVVDTVDIYMSVQDPSAPSAPATSLDVRVSFPNVSPYAKVAAIS